MIVELHAIQSFAPANLNRDDAGAPKDCTFGGVPRARVSSQSWKRAMRVAFRESATAPQAGTRTKRAHEAIVKRIADLEPGLDREVASHRAAVLLEAQPLGLSLKKNDKDEIKTGQLLFFRDEDLDVLAELAIENGDELDGQTTRLAETKGAGPSVSREVAARVKQAMTTPGRALDVALFGRLVAELPEANVDAACQVAHAVGTHRLSSEFDYYTAVDDLKPEDTEGADMIGTIQFNASCFYRYAVVDIDQLRKNLGAAAEDSHVSAALAEFARAFVTAIPSGKQTSFAARNLPAAVLGVRRSAGAMNLANAFVPAVTPSEEGIPATSTRKMLDEFVTLEGMYGAGEDSVKAYLLSGVDPGENGAWQRVSHIEDLLARLADV